MATVESGKALPERLVGFLWALEHVTEWQCGQYIGFHDFETCALLLELLWLEPQRAPTTHRADFAGLI